MTNEETADVLRGLQGLLGCVIQTAQELDRRMEVERANLLGRFFLIGKRAEDCPLLSEVGPGGPYAQTNGETAAEKHGKCSLPDQERAVNSVNGDRPASVLSAAKET